MCCLGVNMLVIHSNPVLYREQKSGRYSTLSLYSPCLLPLSLTPWSVYLTNYLWSSRDGLIILVVLDSVQTIW